MKNMDNLQNKEPTIVELSTELKEIKEKLNELGQILKYGVDKQYYFNAFYNSELLKLQNISDNGILLCGNYGNPNMGDEWMLDTMLDYLRGYSTKEITIMLEPNRTFDPSIYLRYNVNYIHYPQNIFDYDIIVNKFDILVFGGGAIVEDTIYYEAYDYGVNICRTVVDLPLRFISKNKKVFCIGLSTSTSLTNKDYVNKLKQVIKKSTFFSVRDVYSLNTLKSSGINVDKVQIVHDIVYANRHLKKAIEENKNVVKTNIINIGIVFIVAEETKKSFLHLIKKIKDELDNTGKKYKITVIPFYDSWHVDYDFFIKAIDMEKDIEVIPFNSDIQFIIGAFLEQDIMICARYHAILLALCLRIPCVGLYYDTHQHYYNKISYLLEQFAFCLDDCIPLSKLISVNDSILDKVICSKEDRVKAIAKEAQDGLSTFFENNF